MPTFCGLVDVMSVQLGVAMLPTLLSNLAQPLFLIALVIHDILWLRIVLILAELCLLTLGLVVADYPLIGWNILFVGINSVQPVL